jgi:hypothetical protein
MNERIKELAEQAGYSNDFLAIGLPNNMEKFAELIVKECARVVLEDPEKTGIRMYFDEKIAAYVIKKHFGV